MPFLSMLLVSALEILSSENFNKWILPNFHINCNFSIQSINVLGESVHNTTHWCCVEKGHRCPQQTLEHLGMKYTTWVNSSESQENSVDDNENCCKKNKVFYIIGIRVLVSLSKPYGELQETILSLYVNLNMCID